MVDHLDALAPRVGRRSEANLPSVEHDAPGIRDKRAGKDLAQSRFAGAVVADEAEHLAGAQREIDPIERLDRAKGFADVLHPHPDRRVIAQHRRLSRLSSTHLPYGSGPTAPYLKRLRYLSTFSLVTMVIGMSMLRVDLFALLDLQDRLDSGDSLLEGILLDDRNDPAFIDTLDCLRGEVPAEHFDLVGALLARHRGDRADERRFAGRVERVHVGIGGHQVLGSRQGDVLDVLTIDGIEELNVAAGLRGCLEAVETLVLDERIERAYDADLRRAAHLALSRSRRNTCRSARPRPCCRRR